MAGYSIRQLQRDAGVSFRRARETARAARRAGRPIRSAEDALAWLANPPAEDGPEFLAVLHPDDPRHRERLAASVIREIQIAIDKGERLYVEDVKARMIEELGTFKAALFVIAARVAGQSEGASPVEIEKAVADEVDEALTYLTGDDPAKWPDAVLMPLGPLDKSLTLEAEEDFEADYMPQLHPSDPRHRQHAATAEQRTRELQKLWADTISLRLACAVLKEEYGVIRAHFAGFAARVGLTIESDDTPEIVRRRIHDELIAALEELTSAPAGNDPALEELEAV